MDLRIRLICGNDIEDVVQLSLLAWEPVFASFNQVLGSAVYRLIWSDWRTSQREAVEAICRDEKTVVLVAEAEGKVVGFIAYEPHSKEQTGEIQLLAVHPEYQNLGIGTELNTLALTKMKEIGIKIVRVETGGDPSHAPARKCYEKAGYTALPLVRYFKEL